MLVLSALGVQWLVAALGVGIGFGLQEIIANLMGGNIILFERPVRIEDFVPVDDAHGAVAHRPMPVIPGAGQQPDSGC